MGWNWALLTNLDDIQVSIVEVIQFNKILKPIWDMSKMEGQFYKTFLLMRFQYNTFFFITFSL